MIASASVTGARNAPACSRRTRTHSSWSSFLRQSSDSPHVVPRQEPRPFVDLRSGRKSLRSVRKQSSCRIAQENPKWLAVSLSASSLQYPSALFPVGFGSGNGGMLHHFLAGKSAPKPNRLSSVQREKSTAFLRGSRTWVLGPTCLVTAADRQDYQSKMSKAVTLRPKRSPETSVPR